MPPLAAAFFITALLYASVGFGGGSTYNALLVMAGADYRILPAIALCCNIIVVAGGVWRFHREGLSPWRRLAPWLAASVPAAWIGGRVPVSETVFVGLLGGALAFAGARLLLGGAPRDAPAPGRPTPPWIAFAGGGAIGLLSGLVGIGGGIFLAPILYLIGWGSPRLIAAAASAFILVNSLAGLAGQLAKLYDQALLGAFAAYWPLFPAVLAGGQIGSALGARGLSEGLLRRLTAALILYVAARLLLRWSELAFA